MCGIIGINGQKNTQQARLIQALRRLEYRGYDSTGIACLDNNNLEIVKCAGKVAKLEEKLKSHLCEGKIGIAHTRWATHGKVNERNSHPHFTKNLALVHNGIIENYEALKSYLISKHNISFSTETDSEVIVKYLDLYISKGYSLLEAAQKIADKLEGSYAVIAISNKEPDILLAMRSGTPLGIGCTKDESFIGSDAYSIAPFCNNITFLKDGDIAVIKKGNFILYDNQKNIVNRKKHLIETDSHIHSKGNSEYFMHKEILEEPKACNDVLNSYIKNGKIDINFENKIDISKINKIIIIACGTSFYAALTAKYWFENIAKIETIVEIASEFRMKQNFFINSKTITIFVSQSGETADTLESLKIVKNKRAKIISITNVEQSAIAREANTHFPILAGPEIGVASTKAYINQLLVLAILSLKFALINSSYPEDKIKDFINSLISLPKKIKKIFKDEVLYKEIAEELKNYKSVLFIGRMNNYPIALEGALKLKELTYIHAEGIAGGELKHGPIALIDEKIPLFAIAPQDESFNKIVSNIQSVAARKGKIILLSNKKGAEFLHNISYKNIIIDDTNIYTTPICYVVPLQLIAYHTCLAKGFNVDQPRNLAKSVTVE